MREPHIYVGSGSSEFFQATAEMNQEADWGTCQHQTAQCPDTGGMKSRKGVSWLSGAKQRRAGRARLISWSIGQKEAGQNPVGVDAWKIQSFWKSFSPFSAGDDPCSRRSLRADSGSLLIL